ncbi:flagellar biosynthesis protein FlhF [Niveibacterium terrae]|uniref:flagellar biosynthesis protein FlhF n=1 Tax=Niveibacterium terrae TaxID=3373598 RepID=UPI003A92330A
MINVKRYYGRTAREALRLVKEELGPDAVVLSNRAVDGGVEILALPAEEVGAVQAATRPQPAVRPAAAPAPVARPAPAVAARPAASARPAVSRPAAPARPAVARPAAPRPAVFDEEEDFQVSLSTRVARSAQADEAYGKGLVEGVPHMVSDRHAEIRPFIPPRVDHYGNPVEAPLPQRTPEPIWAQREELRAEAAESAPAPRPAPREELRAPAIAAAEADAERVKALEAANSRLMDEVGAIRGLLERQLAGFAWGELTRGAPVRAQIMSDLLEAGFSAALARDLTAAVAADATLESARNQIRAQITRRLLTLDSESDLIERGGVYALVGPTGVGKTTTTAKLAARCVVRHGADRLALITTDGYRIGAHEQLRIYGRILGVTVHAVRDASDLRRTLQDLSGKHMVLIDTIGMSQRDKMVADQAAMLSGAGCVRRLLLLNATSRGDTLEDVVKAYEGPDLAGCILSKSDEAASLAPALDVAIRHELRTYYIANGQRVPEDLHLPSRSWLAHRALREQVPDSPFRLDPEDAGLLASAVHEHSALGGRA